MAMHVHDVVFDVAFGPYELGAEPILVTWANILRYTHTVCLILVNSQELAYTSLNILATLHSRGQAYVITPI